ncbi:MAG TPA: sulfotransferase [Acidimicrobiales bacterium]|nr:sulfotransferase [Acidimicrobiales bacterium]
MTLRVVGAGLGRTGTHSLKLAFEQLLSAPCYHMLEVINRPDQAAVWAGAARGEMPDWANFLSGYAATVDWPAASFWRELTAASPEAVVVLSVRDPEAWWGSATETIFAVLARGAPPDDPGAVAELAMINDVLNRRFTPDWRDRDAAIEAYEAHNAEVRATVAGDRLVEWRPGDGWEPLCTALGISVPDAPFPHVNTTSEFRQMTGLDAGGEDRLEGNGRAEAE